MLGWSFHQRIYNEHCESEEDKYFKDIVTINIFVSTYLRII